MALIGGTTLVGVNVSPLLGLTIGLLALLILVGLALWRMQGALAGLQACLPRLLVKAPRIYDNNGNGVPLHDAKGHEVARAAFVHFLPANTKPDAAETGEEARSVHATVRVLDRQGLRELVPETQARWVEADEQLIRGGRAPNAAEVTERDLPANGREYAIDTVMQIWGEEGVRVWTQSGAINDPLIGEPCLVEVSVEGTNLRKRSYRFPVAPAPSGNPSVGEAQEVSTP